MRKKIIGILIIGLVFALVIPVGSSYILNTNGTTNTKFESKLFVIGVIQIDTFDYEIRGFAVYAINDGEVLLFKNLNIKYDGATPIQVGGVIPFIVHHIYYNPAE